jgi:hypothetical protein
MQATKQGERAAAFCEHCQRIVRTRAEYHTVRLPRTRLSVSHVLVRACENCGDVLEIPRESFPQLRACGASA